MKEEGGLSPVQRSQERRTQYGGWYALGPYGYGWNTHTNWTSQPGSFIFVSIAPKYWPTLGSFDSRISSGDAAAGD